MKKGILVIAVLFLVVGLVFKSDAEMRITPEGASTPDDTAYLRLKGSYNSGGSFGPEGAVISGVNTYSDQYAVNSGGYFSASSNNGQGVYALASGDHGNGIWARASGNNGVGVRGEATAEGNVTNYGGYFTSRGSQGLGVYGYTEGVGGTAVYGKATGSSATGVRGEASYSGSDLIHSYGGDFSALGAWGTGVRGIGRDKGGYFVAFADDQGTGIHAEARGADSTAVNAFADGFTGIGVYSQGGASGWAFYAEGLGGNYGPFTGAHEAKFAQDVPTDITPGLIVSVTGKTQTKIDPSGSICLSSTLPTVALSAKAKDKAVFGVIVSQGPLPGNHWYEAREGERFGIVNALGEGRVWVTNMNGNIQAGDYITTSEIPGYGQMQDDDLLHSYTLGKATEAIDWDQVTEIILHEGKMYKRYLLAVVYTSSLSALES